MSTNLPADSHIASLSRNVIVETLSLLTFAPQQFSKTSASFRKRLFSCLWN